MSSYVMARCGTVLFLIGLLSGCAMFGGHDECRWNRSRCMYDGPYDPGEKDYAEQEAKRLNRQETQRVR